MYIKVDGGAVEIQDEEALDKQMITDGTVVWVRHEECVEPTSSEEHYEPVESDASVVKVASAPKNSSTRGLPKGPAKRARGKGTTEKTESRATPKERRRTGKSDREASRVKSKGKTPEDERTGTIIMEPDPYTVEKTDYRTVEMPVDQHTTGRAARLYYVAEMKADELEVVLLVHQGE